MTSRVVTSWIEALGTDVPDRAMEMVDAIARNDRVVSLPPTVHQRITRKVTADEKIAYLSVSQHCQI